VSSVATAADPIPEADARKSNEVAPTEAKSAEGDEGADVVKEGTVLQAASLPTPATEAAPGPAKDVTVDDEGAVNEDDGCTSVDTASTKQSSGTEGEGFASDVTWEERTWKVLVRLKEDMFWARIGGIRALQA